LSTTTDVGAIQTIDDDPVTTHEFHAFRPERDPIFANALASGGLQATALAFMTAFSVLGSYDYANKFENGQLPPGADAGAGQLAAVRAWGSRSPRSAV
jgi:hypothetical protein